MQDSIGAPSQCNVFIMNIFITRNRIIIIIITNVTMHYASIPIEKLH